MEHHLLESAEFYHRRYHNAASRVVVPVLLLMVFCIAFSCFGQREITISTRATVEPVQVLAQIQSTSNNPILGNHLSENQKISQGDILVEYQSNSEQVQKATTEKKVLELKTQLAQLELLKTSLETNHNQFAQDDQYGYSQMFTEYRQQLETLKGGIEQQNATIASQNAVASQSQAEIDHLMREAEIALSDFKSLKTAIQSGTRVADSNAGYAIYENYQSQINNGIDVSVLKQETLSQIDRHISQIEGQLAANRVQYASSGVRQAYTNTLDSQSEALKAQYLTRVGQEMTNLMTQITDLEGTLALQEDLTAKTRIYAQQTGIVHLNDEVEGATIIPQGTVIAQVYPDLSQIRKVKIRAYVSSKDISRLSKGDKIHFSAQSGEEQVMLTSKVTSIATSATQTESGSFFKVEAETSLSQEQTLALRYGTEGKFVAVTGKQSYFQYFVETFLGIK